MSSFPFFPLLTLLPISVQLSPSLRLHLHPESVSYLHYVSNSQSESLITFPMSLSLSLSSIPLRFSPHLSISLAHSLVVVQGSVVVSRCYDIFPLINISQSICGRVNSKTFLIFRNVCGHQETRVTPHH